MCFNNSVGYGDWENINEIIEMRSLSPKEQKARIKELYAENPQAYFEWKQFCMEGNKLTELFGTISNPILIDESKL